MTSEEALTAAITSDPGDPKSYAEVLRHPDKEKWIEAMIKEIKNFLSRNAWKIVARSNVQARGRNPISVK